MNKQKISNLLGLAQRAGKLISGEELVIKAIQEEKAKLVFLANDAASNLTKKVTDKGHYYEVQVSTVFSTLELSTAIGRPYENVQLQCLILVFSTLELSTAIGRSRKVVAVVDAGFSKKMRSLME